MPRATTPRPLDDAARRALAERRRLARLSDAWADKAMHAALRGRPAFAAYFAEGADRLAAEARAVR